jgi:hypothetical protein
MESAVNEDEIQQILIRIENKSLQFQSKYKLESVRAFYFGLTFFDWQQGYSHGALHDFGLVSYLDPTLKIAIGCDLDNCQKTCEIPFKPSLDFSLAFDLALTRARRGYYEFLFNIDTEGYLPLELDQTFQSLKKQRHEIDKRITKIKLPKDKNYEVRQKSMKEMHKSIENISEKWLNNFVDWLQKLEVYFPHNQDLCRDIELSLKQKQMLQIYYNANLFIGICLSNHDGQQPDEIQQIASILMIPGSEN